MESLKTLKAALERASLSITDEKIDNYDFNALNSFNEDDLASNIKSCDTLANTCLYPSGMNSLIRTLKNNKSKFSDLEWSEIQPFLATWKSALDRTIINNEALPDYFVPKKLYDDFLLALQAFSEAHPEIITSYEKNELIIDLYLEKIWKPHFGEIEDSLKRMSARFNKILKLKTNKYAVLVRNNYKEIDPYQFEELISDLFERMGYKTQVTKKSGDFGVDVIATKGGETIAIQAKKYSPGNNVGNRDVQRMLGAMSFRDYKANKGIIITTSDFTIQAQEQASENPIELWNIAYLNKMMAKYFS